MGIDKYSRNKKGDIIRDGENLSNKKKPSIDIETFIQTSYSEAVRRQNNGQVEIKQQRTVTTQDIRFAKEGYQSNTRVEYIDTKNNQYNFPGSDHVYPKDKTMESTKPSMISKIKKMLNLK
jgi:hypothetical protein